MADLSEVVTFHLQMCASDIPDCVKFYAMRMFLTCWLRSFFTLKKAHDFQILTFVYLYNSGSLTLVYLPQDFSGPPRNAALITPPLHTNLLPCWEEDMCTHMDGHWSQSNQRIHHISLFLFSTWLLKKTQTRLLSLPSSFPQPAAHQQTNWTDTCCQQFNKYDEGHSMQLFDSLGWS